MKLKLFAALLVAASAISCGGVTDPSKNVTENFSDTLAPGGTWVKTFNVSNSGEYSVAVMSTNPATPGNIIGVGFGQEVSGQCAPYTLNAYATVGHTGSAGAIQPGSWCVVVYDPGILTSSITFQGWVKHP